MTMMTLMMVSCTPLNDDRTLLTTPRNRKSNRLFTTCNIFSHLLRPVRRKDEPFSESLNRTVLTHGHGGLH